MRHLFLAALVFGIIFACGKAGDESTGSDTSSTSSASATEDDGKGIGEVKEVQLNNPLDKAMVDRGKAISDLKCVACHRLTDQRVVGPGWAGITERRKPEWIMNMIINVEVMLEQDPVARAQLEECLTRMPNQNLSVADARDVLEYMYANDGYEVGE